jgi:hypothetical protein
MSDFLKDLGPLPAVVYDERGHAPSYTSVRVGSPEDPAVLRARIAVLEVSLLTATRERDAAIAFKEKVWASVATRDLGVRAYTDDMILDVVDGALNVATGSAALRLYLERQAEKDSRYGPKT